MGARPAACGGKGATRKRWRNEDEENDAKRTEAEGRSEERVKRRVPGTVEKIFLRLFFVTVARKDTWSDFN